MAGEAPASSASEIELPRPATRRLDGPQSRRPTGPVGLCHAAATSRYRLSPGRGEFLQVARTLADPNWPGFVGIWGIGGIGKTALAKEAARRNGLALP